MSSQYFFKLTFIMSIIGFTTQSIGQTKKKNKSIQEIEFNELDLNGKNRTPEGSYLVQRSGINFLPLHEIQLNFDDEIRKSHRLTK